MGVLKKIKVNREFFVPAYARLSTLDRVEMFDTPEIMTERLCSVCWLQGPDAPIFYGVTEKSREYPYKSIVVAHEKYAFIIGEDSIAVNSDRAHVMDIIGWDVYERLCRAILGSITITGKITRLHHEIFNNDLMAHDLTEELDLALFHIGRSIKY